MVEADQQEEADTTAKITAADIFEDDSVGTTEPMEGEEMDMEKYPFTMLVMTREGDNTIYVSLSDVDQVDRIISQPEVQNVLPRGTELVWGTREATFQDGYIYKPLFLLNKEAELTGKYLETADFTLGSSADPRNAGRPLVNLTFNEDGRKIFSRVTGANIKKRLAIVLNGLVYTAPTIQTKITHNTAQITGIQDLEEAKVIAIVLRAGALPAPLNIIEERTVGPSLGQDSVNKGITAMIVGLIVVLIFMIIYYGASGAVADFAILLNMLFVVAVMTIFRFTLTLPGIAGLILTVGMALDANVLIFSRIREELAQGKTVMAAIDAGYSRAFLTIFDANLTTFITALVLYIFGTGPIQGFALTLMIGIAASMFTAIFVTRLIFDVYTVKAQPKKLSI